MSAPRGNIRDLRATTIPLSMLLLAPPHLSHASAPCWSCNEYWQLADNFTVQIRHRRDCLLLHAAEYWTPSN